MSKNQGNHTQGRAVRSIHSGLIALSLITLAACGGGGDGGGFEQRMSHGGSHPLVAPIFGEGNFVPTSGVENQICYDIFGANATSELKEFKIDPPVSYADADEGLSFTVSSDGRFLSWESTKGAEVWGVVVKGGPNYNIYSYKYDADGELRDWGGSYPMADEQLQSPAWRRNIPQISHYNVCYQPPPPPDGDQGCTPGYWANHADRWQGVSPGDDFDSTFGVDLFSPDVTLAQAISLGGGDINALARHATAALLNAYGGVPNSDGTSVAYPYTAAEVIQRVQDAVVNGTVEETKDLFDEANNLGCPLGGTRAVKV